MNTDFWGEDSSDQDCPHGNPKTGLAKEWRQRNDGNGMLISHAFAAMPLPAQLPASWSRPPLCVHPFLLLPLFRLQRCKILAGRGDFSRSAAVCAAHQPQRVGRRGRH